MTDELDAVVVGAGFSGLYMLHRLRTLGFAARVFEAGSGVGGTWFWNRYPGARCDVESMEYSYQFSHELQQEWEWSERYASQPEILSYLEHVVDRFELGPHIQLNTYVEAAHFDDAHNRWTIRLRGGAEVSAKFCIMASGVLSVTSTPQIDGLDAYQGRVLHTGRWPHEPIDFGGQRVGVIGTGSSGIQIVPQLAAQARQLFVFQRTPAYSVPAQNSPADRAAQRQIKSNYLEFRREAAQTFTGLRMRSGGKAAMALSETERQAEYERRWTQGGLPFLGAFSDLMTNPESNATAAAFVRGKIRSIVQDPALATTLSPQHTIGCKRLCSDSGYYDAFNRSNVSLVDVSKNPIETFTPSGLRTRDTEYPLDSIVFATGFAAITGALLAIDIRGSGGVKLRDKWAEGARAYLGLCSAGFPNMFVVVGPGSPSVLSNMVPSIEQHVNWIAACMAHMRAHAHARIEPKLDAEDAWVAHVNAISSATLYRACNSWYLGPKVPGKPRLFLAYLGFPHYVKKCDEVAAKGYEGFTLTG